VSDLNTRLRAAINVIDGDADIWGLFADYDLYRDVLRELAAPYRGDVTAVAGVEARGFAVAQALALELGVGFVGVRKGDRFLPGGAHVVRTAGDYKGNKHELRIQKHALAHGDRVVVADDWMETGSSALAVRELVERHAGATFVGAATIVDQVQPDVKQQLGRFTGVISNTDLFAGREQKDYQADAAASR
jgi:adenine phosphoribosyltransferase